MAAALALTLAAAGLTPAIVQPSGLSTVELKKRLEEAQAPLWAWEIESESAREERPGVPAERYVHRIVAAKAPDRFFHWNAHGTPRLDWRDDPTQQRLIVHADRFIIERPLDRFFIEGQLRSGDPLPGTASQELLLTALGWWPLADRPSPPLMNMLPKSLTTVARSSAYQARPTMERVGGRWCQVLECPGRDQIWLDIDRGCAVVARQITYTRPSQVHRIEFADFREMVPKVWVPRTLHNLIYEKAPDGTLGQPIVDGTIHLLQVRLNEAVDDARFQFKPSPGSIADNGHKLLRQVIPGGEEYLDEVVEWSRRYRPKVDIPECQIGWGNWSDMACGALLGGVVITLLFWCPRWIPRRRGES